MHAALSPYARQELRLVTLSTLGGEPVLTGAVAHAWGELLAASQRNKTWRLLGQVTLPNHAHLVLISPKHMTLDQIVWGLVEEFEQVYRQLMGMPACVERVWQPGYRCHTNRTPDDIGRFLDYVHYNPVHHHATARPEEWPHSSYARWVEQGVYKLGWGWQTPESIRGINWE